MLINDSGGYTYQQLPWGTAEIQAQFEFFSDRTNDTALQAANGFHSALFMEERFFDIWLISALNGRISTIDLSQAFREEIEPRVEMRFMINANIVDPLPLRDDKIFDIHTQEVDVKHISIDDKETDVVVIVNDDES
jgi:hypothetical protein